MILPLEGIKVLDLSGMLPGPFCTQILADYGAEVIKIEDQIGDRARHMSPFIDEQGALFYAVNRNKQSIALDLRRAEGKAIFMKLMTKSDVIVDVFRPGVMDKLGLSYEALKKVNPGIIYCALNGFGSTGPYAQTAAHDLNILSLAGITGLTGAKDGLPGISPVQLAGAAGGSLYAVIAILIALHNRQKTGLGQFCDVSMLDGVISLLAYTLAEWSGEQKLPERGNAFLTGAYAFYQIYETSDHKYISLGAIESKFWQEFCRIIGKAEYGVEQWNMELQGEMIAGISTVIKTKTQAAWLDMFASFNICLTPVLSLDEMAEHPQVKARNAIVKLENFQYSGKDMFLGGLPIQFSDTPGAIKTSFPENGQHTAEILSKAGYSTEEIEWFKISGIVY
ncbi:MAG: CaiB/BaiF CoA-transferase family protein [Syntrophomonadaceae bacterium]|nr:CaiB/BaiF CoA-transferase family protein [Syntrophomonadaceae bacterium]